MKIRCVVSCTDSNGAPALFPCTVETEFPYYNDGLHYEEAQEYAKSQGYSNIGIVYDENDGPQFLFDNLFKPND